MFFDDTFIWLWYKTLLFLCFDLSSVFISKKFDITFRTTELDRTESFKIVLDKSKNESCPGFLLYSLVEYLLILFANS